MGTGAPGGRPGRPRTRAHRVEQNAVLLVLLGVKHVVTVGTGGQRSVWGHGLLPFHTCRPVSPFLAESNTHETRLVGPVRFHSAALPAQPSALAPPHDRSREGSDLLASPRKGRSCTQALAASGFGLGSRRLDWIHCLLQSFDILKYLLPNVGLASPVYRIVWDEGRE